MAKFRYKVFGFKAVDFLKFRPWERYRGLNSNALEEGRFRGDERNMQNVAESVMATGLLRGPMIVDGDRIL